MRKGIILAAISFLAIAGCGGGSSGDGDDDLGRQIDGMGRAAINTALVMTFAADATRNAAEDDYNSTSNSERSRFSGTMADQLAVYDALVGTCGDNPLTNRASADPAQGLATGEGRYDFIADVFADDQLYVNTASAGSEGGACNQYLAAELGVVGVPGFAADCGGRTLNHDVIMATYSAVAVGSVSGVDDGIASDNVTHSLTEFPFLRAP